jgi:ferredoxin/flavodoxin
MNKISLKYFTGTGNSLRLLKICENIFKQYDFSVDISSITDNGEISNDCDIIGFCFPVYAFGLPRISKKYLKNLPKQTTDKKVFLLVTCGDSDEVGFALADGIKILKKKNYNVIYSDAIHMPANWTTFINPPSKDEALLILSKGVEKSKKIAINIIDNKEFHRSFNIPKKHSKVHLYRDYYSFHKLGIYQMWKMFRTNDNCNSCGLCAKVCPTNSIDMVDDFPKWKSSCEQCMRCVNMCPQEAIFQTYGGNTEGKNRYIEPHFKPLL